MSLTVLLLAALHGVPIFLAAALTRNKIVTTLIALVMAGVAVAVGGSAYVFIDLAAVAIVYVFCVSVL